MQRGQVIINVVVSCWCCCHAVSQAFGTGALDEENDEEDDVYGTEAITSYDITLATEGDLTEERKFGWTGGLQDGTR